MVPGEEIVSFPRRDGRRKQKQEGESPLHSDLCVLDSPVLSDMKFLLEPRIPRWEDLVLFITPSVALTPANEVAV